MMLRGGYLIRAIALAGMILMIGIGESAAQASRYRVPQTEVVGRRLELSSLKGAVLFVTPEAEKKERLPLIVHFHGPSWVEEYAIATKLPGAVLITVQLGSGSRVYGLPFSNTSTFRSLLDEARAALQLKHEWESITLTGFSAGYGAIRAILRDDNNFKRVDNVLLLDGIHASYVPEGTPPMIKADDLDSFVKFGQLAVAGKKRFVITHSAIHPGAYASTTECTNFVIEGLGLRRRLLPGSSSTGMQQTSAVDAGGFHVRGYAGSTAADHVDHLHSMSTWFGLLKL